MVDDAIRFVSEHQRKRQKKDSTTISAAIDDDHEDIDQVTRTKIQVF